MKKLFLLSITSMLVFHLFAQTTQVVSTGAGYKKQSFFSLAAGTETLVNDDSWDIAFSVSAGAQDAGVFVNESAGSSMGAALPGLVVYWTIAADFSENIDPATLSDDFIQWNDEKSWNFGAFNAERDPADPLDFGWGQFKPATNSIESTDVFVVKLRDGSYKKIEIKSLIGSVFSFRYANLDGTDEQIRTINKTDHAGKLLAYFSLASGTTVAVEPASFDLIFCRYMTKLTIPGTGEVVDYLVTGILSGKGVTAAKALDIDPATVQYATYADSFLTNVDVIGQDWKAFSGTAWSVDLNRVYFVRTTDNHVWKLRFTNFAGSTTGKATVEKTDLGIISGTTGLPDNLSGFDVFPNPTTSETNILLDFGGNSGNRARLFVQNSAGKLVFDQTIFVENGLNGFTLPTDGFPAGVYFLNLDFGNGIVSKKLVKI